MKKLYFLGFLSLFAACDDQFPDTTERDSPVVFDEVEINAYFMDAEDMAESVLSDSDMISRTPTRMDLRVADPRMECATIFLDGNERDQPATIFIDFGEGCTDNMGNVRSGRIRMEISTLERDADNVTTTTFENYRFNNAQVTGSILSDNRLDLENEILNATVRIEDGRISFDDGVYATRNAEMEKSLSLDWDLPAAWTVTGTASGRHIDGHDYYMEIEQPFYYNRECIRSGVYVPSAGRNMFQSRFITAFIDYGENDCDREAVVHMYDNSFNHTFTFKNIYQ